jgi:DNA-binding PadR family transcriptional regulator
MARTESCGQFEQLVLTAILSLGDNAYGVTIHSKVEELSAKPASLGAIYVTLDRLEDKGFLSSRLTDPTAERGGRAKRCYIVEESGSRALRESMESARRMWNEVAAKQKWGKKAWA